MGPQTVLAKIFNLPSVVDQICLVSFWRFENWASSSNVETFDNYLTKQDKSSCYNWHGKQLRACIAICVRFKSIVNSPAKNSPERVSWQFANSFVAYIGSKSRWWSTPNSSQRANVKIPKNTIICNAVRTAIKWAGLGLSCKHRKIQRSAR